MVRIGVSIGRSLITESLNLTLAPLPYLSHFSTPSDCQRQPYLLDVDTSWPVRTIRATPSHDMSIEVYVISFLSLSPSLRLSAG